MNSASNNPARNTKIMNRFDLTSRLIAKLKNEEAVIGGIGNTNFDLWAAGHRPQNFYMLGSMGLAFPIALGVALAQPNRRIFALEGDGSLLMQLGSLSTIATLAPKNLTMVVMDNGVYQITGAQPTPAAAVSDIVAIAVASGLTDSAWAATAATNPAVVGQVSVRALAQLLAGEDPGHNVIVPPTLITQKDLIDKDIKNMEDLSAKLPQFAHADVAMPAWMPNPNAK